MQTRTWIQTGYVDFEASLVDQTWILLSYNSSVEPISKSVYSTLDPTFFLIHLVLGKCVAIPCASISDGHPSHSEFPYKLFCTELQTFPKRSNLMIDHLMECYLIFFGTITRI